MKRFIGHPFFEFAVACVIASLLGGFAMYFSSGILSAGAEGGKIHQNTLLSAVAIAAFAVILIRFHAYLFLKAYLEHVEVKREIELLTKVVKRLRGVSSVIAVVSIAFVLAWVYPG